MTDNTWVKSLCSAIVEQAVNDYRELKEKGVEHIGTNATGNYSRYEIEHFLSGRWGPRILDGMSSKVSGFAILRKLKAE